ncbi:MAG: cytochrome C oxidase subunit IV family protein [Bacteriovoracaceae bacterium]|nr:cytochrome C oxidase subunit IV family protein [Bacteriovoracaceae bacterium]
MSAEVHHSHKAEYFKVFAVLTVLTIVELIIPPLKLKYILHASSLTGLAIGKAAIVGYFYMHLKEETRWMKFVALIPISAVAYAVMVILESLYR